MEGSRPAFARHGPTASYYERRASEYDEWYESQGQFKERERPGWAEELGQLEVLLASLPAARTLDAACGTGYLTRHLRGLVVGLDRSRTMAAMAAERILSGFATVGDALDLPFAEKSFDRVVTAHFYGHLPLLERSTFLAEAQRVAPELLVVDSALRPGVQAEQWQERVLNDGSRHRVYKRYLEPEQLAGEIAGHVLFTGTWFVAARTRRNDD